MRRQSRSEDDDDVADGDEVDEGTDSVWLRLAQATQKSTTDDGRVYYIGVVVPYRSQKGRDRETQLSCLKARLHSLLVDVWLSVVIIVVEQADDGLKFNKGLCNNPKFWIYSLFNGVGCLHAAQILLWRPVASPNY